MSKTVALTDVIIELHVSSFDKVKDFYGKLGFTKVLSSKNFKNIGEVIGKLIK